MYHQFKELAGVDITAEAMEVGPTCHYIMAASWSTPTPPPPPVPGLFAAREVAAAMRGANRLGGNSLCDLLAVRSAAGIGAAESPGPEGGTWPSRRGQIEDAMGARPRPLRP